MNQLAHMDQEYKIKLYRTPKFKIIHFIFLLILLTIISVNIFNLVYTGFSEYFFPQKSFSNIYSDIAFPLGILFLVEYFLNLVINLFIVYLLFLSIFVNHISVKKDQLFVLFSPRLFFRQYKCDISAIMPVKVDELSWFYRILNYNLGKEFLYKFICYDTEFIVSCKDEEHMKMLMEDINSRHNSTENDEENESAFKFTKQDKTIMIVVVVCILGFLQRLFNMLVGY